jgi:hypothetical protein
MISLDVRVMTDMTWIDVCARQGTQDPMLRRTITPSTSDSTDKIKSPPPWSGQYLTGPSDQGW